MSEMAGTSLKNIYFVYLSSPVNYNYSIQMLSVCCHIIIIFVIIGLKNSCYDQSHFHVQLQMKCKSVRDALRSCCCSLRVINGMDTTSMLTRLAWIVCVCVCVCVYECVCVCVYECVYVRMCVLSQPYCVEGPQLVRAHV